MCRFKNFGLAVAQKIDFCFRTQKAFSAAFGWDSYTYNVISQFEGSYTLRIQKNISDDSILEKF